MWLEADQNPRVVGEAEASGTGSQARQQAEAAGTEMQKGLLLVSDKRLGRSWKARLVCRLWTSITCP